MVKLDKILICGSSYLTKEVVNYIKPYYNLVGYVPSESHIFSTNVDLPIVGFNVEYDIILSIQYDQKILDVNNSYNLHTGLLPNWGGCDILYHTLKNKTYEQGLTFHKITDKFDWGNVISKTSYPVLEEDNMIDLYKRIMIIAPNFALSSLNLLKTLSKEEINKCYKAAPLLFRRGNIHNKDLEMYKNFPNLLKKEYK